MSHPNANTLYAGDPNKRAGRLLPQQKPFAGSFFTGPPTSIPRYTPEEEADAMNEAEKVARAIAKQKGKLPSAQQIKLIKEAILVKNKTRQRPTTSSSHVEKEQKNRNAPENNGVTSNPASTISTQESTPEGPISLEEITTAFMTDKQEGTSKRPPLLTSKAFDALTPSAQRSYKADLRAYDKEQKILRQTAARRAQLQDKITALGGEEAPKDATIAEMEALRKKAQLAFATKRREAKVPAQNKEDIGLHHINKDRKKKGLAPLSPAEWALVSSPNKKKAIQNLTTRTRTRSYSDKMKEAARRASNYEVERIMMEKEVARPTAEAISNMQRGASYGSQSANLDVEMEFLNTLD